MGRVGSGLGSGPVKGKEGVIGGIEERGVGLGVDHGKGVGKDAGYPKPVVEGGGTVNVYVGIENGADNTWLVDGAVVGTEIFGEVLVRGMDS